MRVINLHNRHALPGGMEVLFDEITRLLRERGHEVIVFERDNVDIAGLKGKLAAFGSMIYSKASYAHMRELIAKHSPDVVHVHNLYPQISPSVLDACREARVPVVMSIQDYKLTCPTAQHLRDGKVCEKCMGGREYWCAVHNCRGSRSMSVAYAIRNIATRWSGRIERGVTVYMAASEFAKRHIVRAGYPAEKVRVVTNFTALPADATPRGPGEYAAYVGRISPEKGLPILIEAARRSGIPVKIAGSTQKMPELLVNVPPNVEFVGQLRRDQLPDFYRNARCLVVPSVWFEGLPVVCSEAMAFGTPLVVSDIGGLAEAIEHDRSGILCPVGSVDAIEAAMVRYWENPQLAREHGEAARFRAQQEFSIDVYYRRLIETYQAAVDALRSTASLEAQPTGASS